MKNRWLVISLALTLCAFFPSSALAQETTGGMQGVVKDPSGAVVPHAKVVVTGSALVGSKELETDSSGYYRFANLPPGTYTIIVSANGFKTFKRGGLILEVGHLPTSDIVLEVGSTETTVEVSAAPPVIDTTTTQNITNVTNDVIANVPHGLSFQSVIQFAPMARNEPLAGATTNGMASGGTGGSLPGSSGNGQSVGFSIGGAADSESSYLVEGQDTENNSGGYSKANVPFEFIQEVEVKTSGIEAEHGGALGGVINVIMKKGSNAYHGEFFSQYETSGADANPTNAFLRYDPTDGGNRAAGLDPGAQLYQAQKDHFRILRPGFSVGGPIVKDRLFFFLGFAPQINSLSKSVNFGANDGNAGSQYFTQDKQTYYGNARIDVSLTQKIRLYGSWLYQYARETGNSMPISDPVKSQAGFLNTSTFAPLSAFSHGLGWAAPNSTYNIGADISLTPKIVSTTRFGYFFENYHDFGWPTTAPNLVWGTNGVGAFDNSATPAGCTPTPAKPPIPPTACTGNPIPAALAQPGGTTTTPYLNSFTLFNANKHFQFNQDVAFFKGGWWGTHNIKVGYALNHMTNVIDQNGNVPQVFLNVGRGVSHGPATTTGGGNCGTLSADWTTSQASAPCAGLYGYAIVQDFSTILTKPATDNNHAFFAQDSWNVGRGLTLNLGIRIEKEYLPAPAGYTIKSINFNWSDKIEPRLGAAWDPTGHGKMKVFGSYGVVNDVMKLLLAQTSWGAQSYEQCSYALGPDGTAAGFSTADINSIFVNGRACPNGPATTQANWAGGTTPAGLKDAASGVSLIENVNLRPWEPVAPGVKPYRQHEYVVGWDYQINKDWAFEARYDRRRLDHAIEDASLSDPNWGETYTIVNPGEGVNKTIDGYAAFLTSLGEDFGVPGWSFNAGGSLFGTCPTCPANPKAVRNYDGAEFRLSKTPSKGWAGSLSYTWSSLWGNYTGLTTTDQIDGGSTGRNSPDTTRSFDEPFYYFGANGKSNNGPLPTDRPNTFKGYVYYQLPWGKGQSTSFGLFQSLYEGSPMSSYVDLASMPFGQFVAEATYIYGRGKWVNMTTDPATGNITLGTPYSRRTPWFIQSDFNVGHRIKINEHQSIAFEASAFNVLNQRSVTAYYGGFNSVNFATPLVTGPGLSIFNGAATYQALESGYNPTAFVNGVAALPAGCSTSGTPPPICTTPAVPRVIANSWYGKPFLYQNARSIRFTLRYTF
jgi:Carboxypeptidase regulatory-like domain